MNVRKVEANVVDFNELRQMAQQTYGKAFPLEDFEEEHGGMIVEVSGEVNDNLEQYDELNDGGGGGPYLAIAILKNLCNDGLIEPGFYVVEV